MQNLQLGIIQLLTSSSPPIYPIPFLTKSKIWKFDPGLLSKVSDSPTQSKTNSDWNPGLDSWKPHWKTRHLARFHLINMD